MSSRHRIAQNNCAVFNLDWGAQAASLHSSAACRRNRFWVAHASRVLVSASRRNNLFLQKSAIARTQSPTRETRALPGKFMRDAKLVAHAARVASLVLMSLQKRIDEDLKDAMRAKD